MALHNKDIPSYVLTNLIIQPDYKHLTDFIAMVYTDPEF